MEELVVEEEMEVEEDEMAHSFPSLLPSSSFFTSSIQFPRLVDR